MGKRRPLPPDVPPVADTALGATGSPAGFGRVMDAEGVKQAGHGEDVGSVARIASHCRLYCSLKSFWPASLGLAERYCGTWPCLCSEGSGGLPPR